ncbi:MAG: (deoxy)nucleoside triphosphate pyrophosphohydrolase [Henriciella sp.]|nr:(deoxy)nucleoside triphosphate pyrophosphohydrolase [Henriciella sp.]
MKIVYVVAAALINKDGLIMLAQRPEGKSMAGLWEFPGGKIEENETPEQALARELEEELRIQVDPTALEPITFASHSYEDFHLLMPLYALKTWQGSPEPAEGQTLDWVAPQDLRRYPAPAADVPLFDFLVQYYEGMGNAEVVGTS